MNTPSFKEALEKAFTQYCGSKERPEKYLHRATALWAAKFALASAAKVARETKFSRICDDHEADCPEIKYNFNGCAEIADAIEKLSEELG